MADRNSAEIFGTLFEFISQDPMIPRHELAEKLWSMAQQYDFSWCQMDCDAHLIKLGLAKVGIDPEYPEDGEGIIYGPTGEWVD
jgi:hypothetical protein